MAEEDFDIYGDTNFGSNATGEEGYGHEAGHSNPEEEENFNLYDDVSGGSIPHQPHDDGGRGGMQGAGGDAFQQEAQRSPPPMGQEGDIALPETPGIYIGNLTWWTTDQQLEDLLSEFGKIKALKFFEDKVNGKSKGFAFVEFYNTETARLAKEKLQGKDICGKQMVINFVSVHSYRQLTGRTPGQPMPKPPYPGAEAGRGRGRGGYAGPGMGGRGNPMGRGMGRGFGGGFYGGRGGYGGYGRFARGGYPGGFGPAAPHVNPAFFFNEGGPDMGFRPGGFRPDPRMMGPGRDWRDDKPRDDYRDREEYREDYRDDYRDREDDGDDHHRESRKRDREDSHDREKDRDHNREKDRSSEKRSRHKDREEHHERR